MANKKSRSREVALPSRVVREFTRALDLSHEGVEPREWKYIHTIDQRTGREIWSRKELNEYSPEDDLTRKVAFVEKAEFTGRGSGGSSCPELILRVHDEEQECGAAVSWSFYSMVQITQFFKANGIYRPSPNSARLTAQFKGKPIEEYLLDHGVNAATTITGVGVNPNLRKLLKRYCPQ